ncbi:MAG TPA: hypothetical protein DCL00_03665 [Opitutae bacterium]|nr:hypothetical protein [Opitutae bacterium]|tara:strand:- start:419 stop:1378 length:960 start_codon:yes stop_codon:yes gene_type:complete
MKMDGHVHLIGDGSSGRNRWLRRSGLFDRLTEFFFTRQNGLSSRKSGAGLDQAYENHLIELVKDSSLDSVLLLAMDYPHDPDGCKIKHKCKFFVSNDCVLELAKKYPFFVPACSIHPARKDAIEELERCAQAGAKVLKLLPNCHNVNCSNPRYRPFWEAMVRLNLPLLSHTGGEFSVPVLNERYADPRILRLPLETGATVIAAHGAGKSGIFDRDYTQELIGMMQSFPRLFTDNSALASPNRWRTIPALLQPKVQTRVIHGSDFPVPCGGFGPWAGKLLSFSDYRISRSIKNPLERDIFLKRSMGFGESTFFLLSKLLD